MKKHSASNHLTLTQPKGRETLRLEVRFPEGLHYRTAKAFLNRLAAEIEIETLGMASNPTWVVQTSEVGLLGQGKGSMGSVELELGTEAERGAAEIVLTMITNNYHNGRIAGL